MLIHANNLSAGESILWFVAEMEDGYDLRYLAEDGIYEKSILDRPDL